jgi:hypothetical protein
MTRRPASSRVWAATTVFTASVFTAWNAGASDLPPLPPAPDPDSPSPISPEASPPSTAPPTSDTSVEVRFKPSDPDLTLLGSFIVKLPRRGIPAYGSMYSTICDGPCTTSLPPDSYRLAIADAKGQLIPVPDPVVIRGPSTLHAEYRDRTNLRAVGAATFYIGIVGGIVMMVADGATGPKCDCADKPYQPGPLFGAGILVSLVSGIVGLVLAYQHDSVHVSVEPLTLSAAPREGFTAFNASQGQGAALVLHF